MHQSSFVLSIKNSNKEILREFGNKCYLPFYQEYSLFLKNLRSQRAVVSITIDGTDILGGKQLVIAPNDSMDLERFISDGDLLKGRKLKFVPVEGNAQDPSSPANGMVEVKVQWEYTLTPACYPPTGNIWYGPWFYPPLPLQYTYKPSFVATNYHMSQSGGSSFVGGILNEPNNVINCCSTQNFSAVATPTGQKGVTVEGSKSNQSFGTTYTNLLAPEIVTLRLQILAPEEKETFTVGNTKVKYCINCGKKLQGKDKFCSSCGEKQE